MTARQYTNTATPVPLSAAVDGAATTLTVASTTGYPNAPFLIALERGTANEEVCLCTAVTATTFTVTRAYDGTSGKAHAIGAMVEHTVAAIDYREAGSPPRMTTAERNALAGADLWDGRLIYNTDTSQLDIYTNGAWGVASPDLTPYVKVDRSRNAVPLRMVRSGKDANGVFVTVQYYRVGGNLALQSVLSGGASPSYTTRTETEYGTDGTTALTTTTYTLTYDTDGSLTTETVA